MSAVLRLIHAASGMEKPPTSPAPHRSRPNSTYTFPVGEDCLMELVRLAERLRGVCGDPWPFQAAVADMILDMDSGTERSEGDQYRRWGWTRGQYRARKGDLSSTMTNWLSAYGRLRRSESPEINNPATANEQPTGNPKTVEIDQKSESCNPATANEQPTNNHPPYNNYSTPTPTGGSGAPAREGAAESGGDHPVGAVILPDGTRRPDADSVVRIALQQQGWTADQEPVLRLWVETHENKFPTSFDARELRDLIATHGVERVAAGIRWMGREGYLKLSRVGDWLVAGAIEQDAPTDRPLSPAAYGLLSYAEMTRRERGFMGRCEMYRLVSDPSGPIWGRERGSTAAPIPETFAMKVAP